MTALEQSSDMGRKAAEARYGKKDTSLATHFVTYHSRFVTAQPITLRAELVLAFNRGYKAVTAEYGF